MDNFDKASLISEIAETSRRIKADQKVVTKRVAEEKNGLLSSIAEDALEVAGMKHQLGQSEAEVREYLRVALDAIREHFANTKSDEWKEPPTLLLGLYLSVILDDQKAQTSLLKNNHYGTEKFETEEGAIAWPETLLFLAALSAYLKKDLKQAKTYAIEGIAYSQGQEKRHKQWWRFTLFYRYLSECLVALMDKDQEKLCYAMIEIKKLHTKQGEHGRHLDNPPGAISYPSLAVTELAKQNGLNLSI